MDTIYRVTIVLGRGTTGMDIVDMGTIDRGTIWATAL